MAWCKFHRNIPKKPGSSLGFLLAGIGLVFLILVIYESWHNLKGTRSLFSLGKAEWCALIAVVFASVGWIVSAWVTLLNTIKQHTINTLLQMRMSEVFIKNSTKVNARYLSSDGVYVLQREEIEKKSVQACIPELLYVLNYLEFIASAIKCGDLDENLMRQSLRGMFCSTYEASKNLIEKLREPDSNKNGLVNSKIYEHIIWLYNFWYNPKLQRKILIRQNLLENDKYHVAIKKDELCADCLNKFNPSGKVKFSKLRFKVLI